MEEDAALVEVGPRFVLNLIKIFQGSFGGPTLFENQEFQSPNMVRKLIVCDMRHSLQGSYGHGKNVNHKSFGKVMDICYIHMFIYVEFKIIHMFLKGRLKL